jgi:uncharacterized protein (TIGR02594 family)
MSTISDLVKSRTFKLGDSGSDVRKIQLALKARGYPLTGTGYFAQKTDSAVEDFQRKAGLRVTGVVDAATAAQLDQPVKQETAAVASNVPLWLGVSLAHLGLKEGPGSKDNKELVADIKSIASDYQHDATPWCAGWVSFCLARAGEKPSSQPLWALSYSDTKNQPVIRLNGPALGAIAVKKRNGGGHVTFVAGRTKGGALACCGGNQNDEVNVSPYREDVFVGFFWPKGVALPSSTGIKSLPIVNSAGKPVSSEV